MNTDDASGGIRAPDFHPCWGVPSPVQGSNCGFPERGPASPAPPRTGAVSLISEPGGIPGDNIFAGFSDQGLRINSRRSCHCLCPHKRLLEAALHAGRHPLFCAALGAPSGRLPARGLSQELNGWTTVGGGVPPQPRGIRNLNPCSPGPTPSCLQLPAPPQALFPGGAPS